MSDSKLVRSIRESIRGPEWFAEQILEEQERKDKGKHTGYIFAPDSENVE
jgi:hypothetical protein